MCVWFVCHFVLFWSNTLVKSLQIPENGLSHLPERLLLFRHDYTSSNVLQLVNAASEIADETLIEIVLTATRKNHCFFPHMFNSFGCTNSSISNIYHSPNICKQSRWHTNHTSACIGSTFIQNTHILWLLRRNVVRFGAAGIKVWRLQPKLSQTVCG